MGREGAGRGRGLARRGPPTLKRGRGRGWSLSRRRRWSRRQRLRRVPKRRTRRAQLSGTRARLRVRTPRLRRPDRPLRSANRAVRLAQAPPSPYPCPCRPRRPLLGVRIRSCPRSTAGGLAVSGGRETLRVGQGLGVKEEGKRARVVSPGLRVWIRARSCRRVVSPRPVRSGGASSCAAGGQGLLKHEDADGGEARRSWSWSGSWSWRQPC